VWYIFTEVAVQLVRHYNIWRKSMGSMPAEPGKLHFFKQTARLGLTQGGRISIEEITEETGKKEIMNLKLLISSYVPE